MSFILRVPAAATSSQTETDHGWQVISLNGNRLFMVKKIYRSNDNKNQNQKQGQKSQQLLQTEGDLHGHGSR